MYTIKYTSKRRLEQHGEFAEWDRMLSFVTEDFKAAQQHADDLNNTSDTTVYEVEELLS